MQSNVKAQQENILPSPHLFGGGLQGSNEHSRLPTEVNFIRKTQSEIEKDQDAGGLRALLAIIIPLTEVNSGAGSAARP